MGREGTKLEGKEGLLGPFGARYSAERRADALDTEARVIYLPTRDSRRASRLFKAKRVEADPRQWEEATNRLWHK